MRNDEIVITSFNVLDYWEEIGKMIKELGTVASFIIKAEDVPKITIYVTNNYVICGGEMTDPEYKKRILHQQQIWKEQLLAKGIRVFPMVHEDQPYSISGKIICVLGTRRQ